MRLGQELTLKELNSRIQTEEIFLTRNYLRYKKTRDPKHLIEILKVTVLLKQYTQERKRRFDQ